jgi:hypothetical protein
MCHKSNRKKKSNYPKNKRKEKAVDETTAENAKKNRISPQLNKMKINGLR